MSDQQTNVPCNDPSDTGFSRRVFLQSGAAAAALSMVPGWLSSSAYAQTDGALKVVLVGCGGRGKGALSNAIEAAETLGIAVKCIGVCDYFDDRAQQVGQDNGVPAEMRFAGADGYRQLMKTDADMVILATPPLFRPVHLAAAVEAGKHVFMEKPVAVDPPGCRKVMSLGDLAASKGLNIVAGTQRRHQIGYVKHARAIHEGAVGEIVGGQIYWCQSRLWYKNREAGDSDADYMIRNWVSFLETSGDHIVEQHVHQIDVANWFIGRPPVSAVGFGSRQRRVTGNMYDNFSVEFDYGEGCSVHSMCRQINGCYNKVDANFAGTQGRVWDERRIARYDKAEVKLPEVNGLDKPYVQEHVALLSAIVKGEKINEARQVAESTLSAIMGRISAYTGQMVRWDDLMNYKESAWYSLALAPSAEDFESGSVALPKEDVVAVPGE